MSPNRLRSSKATHKWPHFRERFQVFSIFPQRFQTRSIHIIFPKNIEHDPKNTAEWRETIAHWLTPSQVRLDARCRQFFWTSWPFFSQVQTRKVSLLGPRNSRWPCHLVPDSGWGSASAESVKSADRCWAPDESHHDGSSMAHGPRVQVMESAEIEASWQPKLYL